MGYTVSVSRSVFDDICHRLKALEVGIHRVQNRKRITIPVFDKKRLPLNVPDGTLFFTDDSHEFGFVFGGKAYYSKTTSKQL